MNKNFTLFLSLILTCFGLSTNAQVVYEFTTCGSTGQQGPTQAQVNSTYSATNLQGAVTAVSGIQEWTVPAGGQYSIEVFGAKGADKGANVGGEGATVYGEFLLNGGEVIEILVGQVGASGTNGNAAGGGGGSYVVRQAGNVPLAIAGGGSGATGGSDGNDGLAGNDGGDGDNCAGNGGTNGNGGGAAGSCNNGAGGGGGFLTDGSNASSCGSQRGLGYANGGGGGLSSSGGATGGFGGGAGTHTNNTGGGAGGGYSGGGAPFHGNGWSGGGGGSYNVGTSTVNTTGGNNGAGMVVISVLSSPEPNNVGVGSFVNPSLVSNLICAGNDSVVVNLQNFGSNQITSLDVDWTVNGVAQPTFSYVGLLDTFGGNFSTTDMVNLGTVNFTGATELVAWTSMPNGNNDTINVNDTATFMIDSVITVMLDLGPDKSVCDGAFTIIENTASNLTFDDYDWSTGAGSSSIVTNNPGTYSVTVTEGPPNCMASDEITITAASSPTVDLGTAIEGCGDVTINAQNPGSDFDWSNGDTTQTISVASSGTYTVSVTSPEGCFGSDEVEVTVNPLPFVTLGPDFEICIDDGGATNIGPLNDPNNTYLWSNNKTTSQIFVGAPGSSTGNKTFWIEVTDANGCVGTDTVQIRYKKCLTGIASLDNNNAWVVYPSPTNGAATIDMNIDASNVDITLFNINGERISNVYRGNPQSAAQINADFSGLASGVYILKLQTEEFVSSKQIVIQH